MEVDKNYYATGVLFIMLLFVLSNYSTLQNPRCAYVKVHMIFNTQMLPLRMWDNFIGTNTILVVFIILFHLLIIDF